MIVSVLVPGPPEVTKFIISYTLITSINLSRKTNMINGLIIGIIINQKIWKFEAPSIFAASIGSGFRDISTENKIIVTNGVHCQISININEKRADEVSPKKFILWEKILNRIELNMPKS